MPRRARSWRARPSPAAGGRAWSAPISGPPASRVDPSHREDDLAVEVAVDHAAEPAGGVPEGQLTVDDRAHPGGHEEGQQLLQLGAVAHRRAQYVDLREEDAREVGLDGKTARPATDDDTSARAGRPDRVVPGRLADAVEDRIDPAGQPRAGLEDGVGADVEGPLALVLAAAGRPYPQAGCAGEGDRRRRDTAAGTLHEHGVAGLG